MLNVQGILHKPVNEKETTKTIWRLTLIILLNECTTCLNILSECIACHNKSDQGLICSVTKYAEESDKTYYSKACLLLT